jgi:hypothetical protein
MKTPKVRTVLKNSNPEKRLLVVRKAKKMSKQEVTLALQVPDKHPLWRAVNQFFQEELEDLENMIIADDLAHHPNSLMRLAGALAQVKTLYERFLDMKSEASRLEKVEAGVSR